MKKLVLPLLLLLSLQSAFGQFSWNAELNLKGMTSTEKDQLPFWMHHNQRGRIAKNTNFAGWITGTGTYSFSNNSVLEVGVGVLGREGEGDDVFADELYAHYETRSWSFTAGRKQQEELYNGLSASNRSILWSLNARPLPGFQLKTNRPVFIFKKFGFEAAWEEYLMEDNRIVENTRLHHKSFHFVFNTANGDLELKAGIQHFAQWGGISPIYGHQPKSFKDYLRIIVGWNGGEDAFIGEQQNALGNHLGSYEVFVKKKFSSFSVEILYNHIFEDGSGRRLGNTPDGRYGIFLNRKVQEHLINSVIYEFYTTHHQSHTTSGPHKNDNYFNNGIYGGWEYNNFILGAPFFTLSEDGNRIINNKFTVHHLGIGGNISTSTGELPYRLLVSYAQNDGRRDIRYKPKQDVIYALYDIKILQKAVEVNLQLAAEYDNYKSPIYGAGVHLVYRIE